jgi:DNA repair exonuclease SbcCD ATPase subunit
VQPKSLDSAPDPRARFTSLDAPLNDAKIMAAARRDFEDWAYRSAQVQVRANEKLGVYAGPQVSQAEFRTLCSDAARTSRDAELEKVEKSYQTKLQRIEDRLAGEQRELREDEAEYSQRKLEEFGTHAENILGLFGGRKRRLSTSLSKRRMTEKAKSDIEESQEAIQQYQKDIAELEKEKALALEEINQKWSDVVDDVAEISVSPYKKDVLVDLFGVAWLPYHVVQVGDQVLELPGYGEVQA